MSKVSDFISKLELSIENLITLKVVTRIAASSGATGASSDGAAKAITTTIDLLQGDITTEIDPAFVGDSYKALRDFHASREKQAMDIIKTNIEAIEKLCQMIADEK